jgi:hypothetical protein
VSGRLGVTLAGGRRSGLRRGRSAVVTHRSWPYMTLMTSVFNEDFTYDIEVTWRTYFAHLGRTAGNDDGSCGRGSLAQARR